MASVGHSPYTSKPSPLAGTASQTPTTPSNFSHASPSPIVPSFPISQPPAPMKRPLPPESHGPAGGPPERKFSIESAQGDHSSQQAQKKKRVLRESRNVTANFLVSTVSVGLEMLAKSRKKNGDTDHFTTFSAESPRVMRPSRAGSTYHLEPQEAVQLERGGSSDDDNLAKVGKGWLGEIEGPHKIAELVQELPPKPFADRIIDWFFAKLNFIRYPIDERLFRASYEDLYNKSTALDPSNVRALPLVFIVLALAVRQAPEKWAGNEQTRRLSSLRMYWSSRRSILIATAVQSESLELVVSRLLSAMYLVLIHDRRLTECWSQLGASLRTAQAIGLHRDGSKLGLEAPSNIDLAEYNPALGLPPAKPFHEPTPALFLILRKKLAVVIGKIVHHFQKLNEPAQYSDVEKLQQELDLFVEQLPPHFRMHDPDKSLDNVHFWLPVHRFMLLTEVLVTTIILHRPWLLRKLSSNRYAASRTACFEAAKLDFQIRQDFQRVPDFKLFTITGQFRMFNSAMIAGISAIIDPRGPDSDQMRKILTTFLEDNPWHEVATKDATTRKEVQIIQTLSRRAAKIFEDSFGPGEPAAHDKDSAALLLALRQSNDSSTQSNTYPKGVQPEDAPTPEGPSLMQHNKMMLPPRTWGPPSGVTFAPVHHGGINQSPASTCSHEDDHSQKLLDHWINANTSLAVGGPSSGGPLPVLDASGMGYLPLPAMSGAMTPMGLPGGPGLTPNPAFAGYGGQPIMEESGNNFMGHHSTGEFTYPNQFGMLAVEGTVAGIGNGRAGLDSGVENSDEYWNTLIDGTTGGMSGPSHAGGA
ncbi:hypothetical protein I309_03974 [Cryptococcus deuterogattii LA55]|nr:hypothetical protein I309_03974 [Cryptococcus deuterogattii LA55]KIR32020.1 hypothetical protein I352_05649 [Cryptococcus deuterogattii MMRL2647]KIR71433.1 hypothetical protein I310_04740 [Cryptococcus deuterogattii CA1014]KIR91012.1 hypothetical protein I304_05108 [Cryptococcus deuterogattii CBS 10090]KIR96235.1 hypothetical protein L804_06359 [Cryptococcus deuterogattii 2001/935-1]